jgi:hypothetical protein
MVMQKQVWPPRFVNHSDDELAFLSYYPLLILERDPHLRRVYLASISRSYQIERPERSPLFNLIYGAALQASAWTDPQQRPDKAYVEFNEYDGAECLDWFRDVPADTIGWTVRNSHRRDELGVVPDGLASGLRLGLQVGGDQSHRPVRRRHHAGRVVVDRADRRDATVAAQFNCASGIAR